MSYTHNMNAQYRDDVLQAREEVSEGRKEFYKLFGAAGFSVLAAAACGGGSGAAVSSGSGSLTGGPATLEPVYQDYSEILGPNAEGWKYMSAMRDDYIYMNYGTQGSLPVPVLQDLADWHRDVAYSPAGPLPWRVFNAVIRAENAKPMYGCLPEEMITSFNTTDGMIKLITGIKWNRGDVVLLTNNEHGGGLGPLHMVANRFGLVLVEVNIPTGTSKGPGTGGYAEDGELVNRFEAVRAQYAAQGKTVRAIMFSTPPYTLGWRLQERELCEWAWGKGILSIVDGAHIPGASLVDLHKMGCDYFAGAGAKWQCGPGQTGYAYVRMGKAGMNPSTTFQNRDVTVEDWANPNAMEPFYICSSGAQFPNPTPTTKGWQGYWDITRGDDLGGAVAGVGNPNYPTLKIIYEVNKIWNSIGRANISKYIESLAQYFRQKVAQSGKMGLYSLGINFQTPTGIKPGHPDFPLMLQTGLTGVNPFGATKDFNEVLPAATAAAQNAAARAVVNRLKTEYGIVIRSMSSKYQWRTNPAKSARANYVNGQPANPGTNTAASALRISTGPYTTVANVDRLVDALNALL